MNDIEAASRVYVDTSIFVYFIEATPNFHPKAKALFERIDTMGASIWTSELTVAECMYKPAQDKNAALLAIYETLFEKTGGIELLALDGAVAKRAALRGGELGLRLIDAIHYLTALEQGCDIFVTSDKNFKSGPRMRVITM
jgi:predicted nucleic acid-binding protein